MPAAGVLEVVIKVLIAPGQGVVVGEEHIQKER
jgi:hypothetical protein